MWLNVAMTFTAKHCALGLTSCNQKMPPAEGQEQGGIFVHHGFYEGARQHANAIVAVIQQQNQEAGRALPVWVSGHSLGGAYANCIMLHLLANQRTALLFTAGNSPLTVFLGRLPSLCFAPHTENSHRQCTYGSVLQTRQLEPLL